MNVWAPYDLTGIETLQIPRNYALELQEACGPPARRKWQNKILKRTDTKVTPSHQSACFAQWQERNYDLVDHANAVTILPLDEEGMVHFVRQYRVGAERIA